MVWFLTMPHNPSRDLPYGQNTLVQLSQIFAGTLSRSACGLHLPTSDGRDHGLITIPTSLPGTVGRISGPCTAHGKYRQYHQMYFPVPFPQTSLSHSVGKTKMPPSWRCGQTGRVGPTVLSPSINTSTGLQLCPTSWWPVSASSRCS